MKKNILLASFFSQNRNKFKDLLEKNSIALISSNDFIRKSAEQDYPFCQNSYFFYLTGLEQEKSMLMIAKLSNKSYNEEILFIQKKNPELERWQGHKYSKSEAKSISGVNNVFFVDDFENVLKDYMKNKINKVYFIDSKINSCSNEVLKNRVNKLFPNLKIDNASVLLDKLRLIKNNYEIKAIKESIKITKEALLKTIVKIKPEIYEFQVSANLQYEILSNNAINSFDTIVASGKNACVLHYTEANSKIKDGELLLIDFGVEKEHYASDCSRTLPVNGVFNKRQKECYNAVLRVFKKAVKLYKPGYTIEKLNKKVAKFMEKEMIELGLFSKEELKKQDNEKPLYKKYFMHGLAHYVGLDVHDVGEKNIPFKKGMVLTCEPGLYIDEEGIGVRIENMIIVDDEPIDLMKDFPIETHEIEKIMKNNI